MSYQVIDAKIRKYTKSKTSFPDDNSVKKSVYLALREITKKWTQPADLHARPHLTVS
ncbi:MAG: hypothetical protein MI975_09320 [Cytophagales bacterium]|nr:hypothetical protein [Cytophagales bacterium]